MNRIDDDRVCFYLRNRKDIDEWCALRKEATRVLDDFLQETAGEIEVLAGELGSDVLKRKRFSGSGSSYLRFLRKSWLAGDVVRAAIGVEWRASSVVFFERPRREPGVSSSRRMQGRTWRRFRSRSSGRATCSSCWKANVHPRMA